MRLVLRLSERPCYVLRNAPVTFIGTPIEAPLSTYKHGAVRRPKTQGPTD